MANKAIDSKRLENKDGKRKISKSDFIEVGNAEEKPVDMGDQLEYDGRLEIKAKDLKGLETLNGNKKRTKVAEGMDWQLNRVLLEGWQQRNPMMQSGLKETTLRESQWI